VLPLNVMVIKISLNIKATLILDGIRE